ncbi:hypothetical protein C0993_001050 [Termitomyces sp. T159_Od127]|nr:hypothetical protein C0993_001050 [Termitomyces sp. T159_Od127]
MAIKSILLNITYPVDGLSRPFPVLLEGLPAIGGYVLQATNINNLNEIWDQSLAFSISDPNSISTSTTNGPTTIFATTTITATQSSLGSSSISSATTTSLSPMSQSTSTPSISSPTNSVSSTSSVLDTVTNSSTPSQASDLDKTVPLGSIVGGTLGGLVLILLLVLALVFSRMRHKKKRLTDHEDFFIDPKVHAASIVTPFSVPHGSTLDSSSTHSHRNFSSISESYGHTKAMSYGFEHKMDSIPGAPTPDISAHESRSPHSQTGLQPPKSSLHVTPSIGGTSIVSSQPFTDSTGRPTTSVPYTGSCPAQHSPHIPVLKLPVSLPSESATAIPGSSTGASSSATQQPWRPLMVVGGVSCDIDDELPPPSYSSGILGASVREK